ncbi:MAG: cyclic nucleotide-binding domain-containing protein [Gammaproteobacteria bacterium]|nr:cyclic nucleotide-binding domain-containing protein [Gammaproteobacteria bacterium]
MQQVDATTAIELLGIPHLQELSAFGALSEDAIVDLLTHGKIERVLKGEYIKHFSEEAHDFQVVLQGKIAYYKHFEGHDVLTRCFRQGEQMGFDEMIGLIRRDGTDVAAEDSLILNISSIQFYQLHDRHPADFGIFMINLARELAREIEMLEEVIGRGTGWLGETA